MKLVLSIYVEYHRQMKYFQIASNNMICMLNVTSESVKKSTSNSLDHDFWQGQETIVDCYLSFPLIKQCGYLAYHLQEIQNLWNEFVVYF